MKTKLLKKTPISSIRTRTRLTRSKGKGKENQTQVGLETSHQHRVVGKGRKGRCANQYAN